MALLIPPTRFLLHLQCLRQQGFPASTQPADIYELGLCHYYLAVSVRGLDEKTERRRVAPRKGVIGSRKANRDELEGDGVIGVRQDRECDEGHVEEVLDVYRTYVARFNNGRARSGKGEKNTVK
jgi:hypothetical protein